MKRLLFLLLVSFAAKASPAQLLKRFGRSVKAQVEQRANIEVSKGIDKGINKGIEAATPKKKNSREKETPAETPAAEPATAQPNNNTGKSDAEKNETAGGLSEGFIEMELSSPVVFTGGTLTISGKSGNYKDMKKIDLLIAGPGLSNTYPAHLDKDGNFTVKWIAPATAGNYKITGTSSDKKSTTQSSFTVEYLDELDEMADENITVVEKMISLVSKRIDEAKKDLGAKHKSEADTKLKELKSKTDRLKAIFGRINEAGEIISKAAKKGSVLPQNTSAHMSELKDALHQHKEQSEKMLEQVEHKTNAYTICETLEMVSEACAAFSTVTNFTGHLKSVAKNLVLDKAVPMAGNELNEFAFNKKIPNEAVTPAVKLLAAAADDAQGLVQGSGPLGMAGDVTQLFSNILLNEYCGSFEGEVTHDYRVDIRNSSRVTWWKYGYATKAKLTLHYPKNKGNGSVVHMKGHIEGNAVKFSFYQNMVEEDEFKTTSKGRVTLIPWATFQPVAVPVATSQADKAGFGMMARAAATPSYFNLPIDATYDRDQGTIRIFMTEGGIDFTPAVRNRVLFVAMVPLPIFKIQEFPINKAKLTMNAVIKRYGEYKVIADGKGGLRFSGTKTHHAGSASTDMETKVNLTINAKN